MKTKNIIIFTAFTVAIAITGCRTNKKTNVPLFSQQDSAYVLTQDSVWIKTVEFGNNKEMFCKRRIGSGPAVKIKIFRPGVLREVYRKYFTDYDTVTYRPTDSIMNLELRSRQVQAGEYWVIAAADIYLDDQLVREQKDGNQYYGEPSLEEIKDTAWTPKNYSQTFISLKELDNYAQKNNCWLVICSEQTMDLLGWEYEPTECFLLSIFGKKLPVLKLKSWGTEKTEWDGVHIHYRYLCIAWGGRDIEYGPGVSAFNVKNENDPGSLDDDDFVKVNCHNGDGYYFGDKVDGFSLKNFKGI